MLVLVMKYDIEMASVGVIYIPSFAKIGLGVRKLLAGIHVHTHTQQNDLYTRNLIFETRKVDYRQIVTFIFGVLMKARGPVMMTI
jgi:hypothetical protein